MARTQGHGKRSNHARKQARAVRTAPPPVSAESGADASTAAPKTAIPYKAGKPTTAAPRPVTTLHTLPRELEYAFIREDLVRLLITSGILTVVMIALLFVVER